MKILNLHDHQQTAVDMVTDDYRAGSRRIMLQCPTGAGKTVIAAHLADRALKKNGRVIFTVPAIWLIDQTVKAFEAEGLEAIGVIQAQHERTDHSQPIQICSLQTLQNRDVPPATIVFVDEAHAWFTWVGDWMAEEAWKKTLFIGLTATPWTKGLGKHYSSLCIPTTTADLIDKKLLSPFRVFAPSHPDLTGVKTIAGDYHEGQLSEAMQRGTLTGDIVETWQAKGEGRSTLCYTVDRAHGRAVHEAFAAAGVASAYVDANTPPAERREVELLFSEKHLKVVVNIGVLTKGIDWPVECIILARPTKSEMLYVQIIGRGLRTAEGKKDCLILDHSSTTERLGFVTDIHHDTLDGGDYAASEGVKAVKAEAMPKCCPACQYLKPPGEWECSSCGFTPKRQSPIVHAPGELRELTYQPPAKYSTEDKALWWAGISGYAQSRGKSTGWAAHTFKSRFGVWPNRYRDVPPIQPTADMLGYIRSRAIAWARSQDKLKGVNHP